MGRCSEQEGVLNLTTSELRVVGGVLAVSGWRFGMLRTRLGNQETTRCMGWCPNMVYKTMWKLWIRNVNPRYERSTSRRVVLFPYDEKSTPYYAYAFYAGTKFMCMFKLYYKLCYKLVYCPLPNRF